MPVYDAALFDPPAPVAYVTLRRMGTPAVRDNIIMLLDTGADVTLVPRRIIEEMEVPILTDKQYEVGRNVLNAVSLRLNGPALMWDKS